LGCYYFMGVVCQTHTSKVEWWKNSLEIISGEHALTCFIDLFIKIFFGGGGGGEGKGHMSINLKKVKVEREYIFN
jgi:hypothetical protein